MKKRGLDAMKFKEQHLNFMTYTHDKYYTNSLPYSFIGNLKGYLHSELMNNDPDEINFIALELQHQLTSIAGVEPGYSGPYEYILEDITSTLRKLERKGFDYFMDGLASILVHFGNEETFNNFLEENNIGFIAFLLQGKVHWDIREDVDIPVKMIEEIIPLIPNVYKDTIASLEHAIKLFNDAKNEKARKNALRECISAVEGFMKSITGTTNIKFADSEISKKTYAHTIITRDAIKIWNHIHTDLLDVRHGNNEFISNLGIEEVTYYIERLMAYIKYINSKTR